MNDEMIMRQHTAIDRRELGYARRVCRLCGTNWPCPEYAQARERYWELFCSACGSSPCTCTEGRTI